MTEVAYQGGGRKPDRKNQPHYPNPNLSMVPWLVWSVECGVWNMRVLLENGRFFGLSGTKINLTLFLLYFMRIYILTVHPGFGVCCVRSYYLLLFDLYYYSIWMAINFTKSGYPISWHLNSATVMTVTCRMAVFHT